MLELVLPTELVVSSDDGTVESPLPLSAAGLQAVATRSSAITALVLGRVGTCLILPITDWWWVRFRAG
jgi:hypothetical protein